MNTFLLILGLVVAIYFLIKLRGWASKNKIIGNDQPQLSETKKKKKSQGFIKGLADYITKEKVPRSAFIKIAKDGYKEFLLIQKEKSKDDEVEKEIYEQHIEEDFEPRINSEFEQIGDDFSNAENTFEQAIILRRNILDEITLLGANLALIYSTDEEISSAFAADILNPHRFKDEKTWFSGIYVDIALHTAILSSLRTCSRKIFEDCSANDYAEAFMHGTKYQFEHMIKNTHKNPKKMDKTELMFEDSLMKAHDKAMKDIEEDAMAGKMIEYNIDELKKLTPF